MHVLLIERHENDIHRRISHAIDVGPAAGAGDLTGAGIVELWRAALRLNNHAKLVSVAREPASAACSKRSPWCCNRQTCRDRD